MERGTPAEGRDVATVSTLGAGRAAGRFRLTGNGRGGLAPSRGDAVSGWVAIAPDLDGDGKPELVATAPEASVLRVWQP